MENARYMSYEQLDEIFEQCEIWEASEPLCVDEREDDVRRARGGRDDANRPLS